jgi:hypothetical protein
MSLSLPGKKPIWLKPCGKKQGFNKQCEKHGILSLLFTTVTSYFYVLFVLVRQGCQIKQL